MQAQHHRVCSLGEAIAFFVVSEQKDGDSADNSAPSSYGLMCGGGQTQSNSAATAAISDRLLHMRSDDSDIFWGSENQTPSSYLAKFVENRATVLHRWYAQHPCLTANR